MDRAEKQAIYRLGQIDMREAAEALLLDLADGTQGVVCATLIDAAQRVRELSVCEKAEGMPVVTPEERKTIPVTCPVYVCKVYDFEICEGAEELKHCLANINYHGFDVVGFTQSGSVYTVLFRRSKA